MGDGPRLAGPGAAGPRAGAHRSAGEVSDQLGRFLSPLIGRDNDGNRAEEHARGRARWKVRQ